MSNIEIAEAYYRAMSEKNIENVGKYLHSDIRFISPLSENRGKSGVLETVNGFINFFETLTIRSKFISEDQDDQVMITYDLKFPEPIGNSRGAAHLTIQDGLIIRIELYYDSHPFRMNR